MADTKFCQLSSLVLVDILAALPMEHVVRIARLGHENLRHTSSLKWVKDRMTHVTFRALVRARQTGGDLAATFSTISVLKSFNGRMSLRYNDFENTEYIDCCMEIAKEATGHLHLISKSSGRRVSDVARRNVEKIETSLSTKLTYVSQTFKKATEIFVTEIERFPEIVFEYIYITENRRHHVYYRPALLNGRHVVDVLRAVCGPVVVSEAELSCVRSKVTERVWHLGEYGSELEGVWTADWCGGAVIASE